MPLTTKGQMIKHLKKLGIRTGEKGSAVVKLEHLKYEDVCKLFDKVENNFIVGKNTSTGDSEYFGDWLRAKEACII